MHIHPYNLINKYREKTLDPVKWFDYTMDHLAFLAFFLGVAAVVDSFFRLYARPFDLVEAFLFLLPPNAVSQLSAYSLVDPL